ncbi:serologically defined colon cancer antigen 8 homolog isoform X4 [Nilaparvata lugens]|uniref:serologically defined colon cancer antigen 8 homolog isoform X4 n=1 Tax=Nilaparvata lugens TaxID=108931 RepID=UPI00193D1747|nr:serologically defined colon cancer antigen 8 homolog isoform X4 [Nilaparvata lugens]
MQSSRRPRAAVLPPPQSGRHLRPRLSHSASSLSEMLRSKKSKPRKGGRMDNLRKRTTDYTDFAYKEAVSKLRYLLAESYNPASGLPKYTISHHHRHHHTVFADEVGTGTEMTSLPMPITHVSPPKRPFPVPTNSAHQQPAELISFIEKQEEYIEQLEKESQYCRDELSNLMGKVKEVISENEGLHERRKSGILKTAFDSFEMEDYEDYDDDANDEKEYKVTEPNSKRPLMGPNIVYESRISELEAQLTQAKMDLRKAQEEADSLRKQLAESRVYPSSVAVENISELDSDRQIQMLQREKEELMEIVEKLQATVAQIRDKEANATQKVRRSLDVVDQAQFEKNQAELEVRRLKTEVDRLNEKLRESAAEQTRRLTEVERRYATQAEQLSGDLASQWDNNTRLNLELDRQRRLETDLRRDLLHKAATIDDLKKELNSRITCRVKVGPVCPKGSLQSEVVAAGAEREGLETEAASARMALERAERAAKHDSARMQAEVQALRQRLDRADADLLHSRKENLRLGEHVSSLERELHMAKLANEEVGSMKDSKREKELTAMIMDMDSKHVKNVAELEGMIQSQTQLMEKLKDECQMLTRRLEDCTTRHKRDRSSLKDQNEKLVDRLSRVWENCKDLRTVCAQYGIDVDGQLIALC